MKKYEMPEIELKKFELEDIIATSEVEENDPNCPNATGFA